MLAIIIIMPVSQHPDLEKFFLLNNANLPWGSISSHFRYLVDLTGSLGSLPLYVD